MSRGKQTCRILKEIRRQIAQANDIEFVTSECRYRGDCPGTCPKCEAEVRYLEQQLRTRTLTGKAVALAGISAAAISMFASVPVKAQDLQEPAPLPEESVQTVADTITVKGTVIESYTLNNIWNEEPVHGAVIINRRTGLHSVTDIDGKFSLQASEGDTLDIRYIGFFPQTLKVTKDTKDVVIELLVNEEELTTGVIVEAYTFAPAKMKVGKPAVAPQEPIKPRKK